MTIQFWIVPSILKIENAGPDLAWNDLHRQPGQE